MSRNGLENQYRFLHPEERFRLILAASGRGDEVERQRLAAAGNKVQVSIKDHAPYAQAFDDVAQMTYLELLDECARYMDAFNYLDEVSRDCDLDDCGEDEGEEDSLRSTNTDAVAGPIEDSSLEDRYRDLALATGFALRTKAAGWQLFCQRLNAHPWQLWERLPGYERLQRALALTEKAAFVEQGFLRWFNEVAPAGVPPATQVPFTAESIAQTTEAAYQELVEWWNGGQMPV